MMMMMMIRVTDDNEGQQQRKTAIAVFKVLILRRAFRAEKVTQCNPQLQIPQAPRRSLN